MLGENVLPPVCSHFAAWLSHSRSIDLSAGRPMKNRSFLPFLFATLEPPHTWCFHPQPPLAIQLLSSCPKPSHAPGPHHPFAAAPPTPHPRACFCMSVLFLQSQCLGKRVIVMTQSRTAHTQTYALRTRYIRGMCTSSQFPVKCVRSQPWDPAPQHSAKL